MDYETAMCHAGLIADALNAQTKAIEEQMKEQTKAMKELLHEYRLSQRGSAGRG